MICAMLLINHGATIAIRIATSATTEIATALTWPRSWPRPLFKHCL